jgi:hypothetical protein
MRWPDERRAGRPQALLEHLPEALALALARAELGLEAVLEALVADHHHAHHGDDVDDHPEERVDAVHVSILVMRRMITKPTKKRMPAKPSAASPSGLPATRSSVPGRVRSARKSAAPPMNMTT